jgi:hypothetical protein
MHGRESGEPGGELFPDSHLDAKQPKDNDQGHEN